ncbi:glycosyltransferase [Glacieibacterium sp.]|uniref:glycosyltransferase n=1 Tax=Glacieibacterium sp. TaxID=2860237 RepID=UPI003B001390
MSDVNGAIVLARDLTLSVVSHGHGGLLTSLLDDLDNQATLAGTKVVVTLNVAEDLSFDSYANILVTVVRNSVPKGFGANHNAAFEHCTTRWFAVLNPDLRIAEVEPFSSLVRLAATIPNVGVLAPRILSSCGETEDAVRTNLTPWSLLLRRHGRRGVVTPDLPTRRGRAFYWLAGMSLMFDAAAYRQIGGFDERFFLYCEDYEICARLYANGYALAVDRHSKIVHDAQRDSHRSVKHLVWHLTSLLRVWTSMSFWSVTLRR